MDMAEICRNLTLKIVWNLIIFSSHTKLSSSNLHRKFHQKYSLPCNIKRVSKSEVLRHNYTFILGIISEKPGIRRVLRLEDDEVEQVQFDFVLVADAMLLTRLENLKPPHSSVSQRTFHFPKRNWIYKKNSIPVLCFIYILHKLQLLHCWYNLTDFTNAGVSAT